MEIKNITIVALILILISSIALIKNQKIKISQSNEANIKSINSLLDSINNNVEKIDELELTLSKRFKKSSFVDSIAIKKEINRISNITIKQQLAKIENLKTDSEEQKRLNKNLARNHRTLIESREERFERFEREMYMNSLVSPLASPKELTKAIQRLEREILESKRQWYYSESKIKEIYADLKKITFSSNNRIELERINEEL